MKKYITPTSFIYELHVPKMLTTSSQQDGHMQGLTLEEAAPLKRLHPIFVRYEKLEPDIKEKLKQDSYVVNYRKLEMMAIEYTMLACTYKEENSDLCTCFYVLLLNQAGYIVFYNIYDVLEPFLMQIRVKTDSVYHYNLTPEVRKKMPTLCKLLSNADKNDMTPTYGLPMISFLDIENKYPLLSAGFKYNDEENDKTFEAIHDSLFKILNQIAKEADNAGILNQSIITALKKGLKILLLARHFYCLP